MCICPEVTQQPLYPVLRCTGHLCGHAHDSSTHGNDTRSPACMRMLLCLFNYLVYTYMIRYMSSSLVSVYTSPQLDTCYILCMFMLL